MSQREFPKLLKMARLYPCMNCGADDNTIVACHYQGRMGHKVGRGMGRKAHDAAIAFLCGQCHDIVDDRTNQADEATRLAIQATAMANTWLALINDGRVEIK